MSIMAGILAGGQGLARGIDAVGAQFADAREKEAFWQLLLNSGLGAPQQQAVTSLASLGQPTAVQPQLAPMRAAPIAPVQTAAIPPIQRQAMSTPENQGIMDRFAAEKMQAWGGAKLPSSSNAMAFAQTPSGMMGEPRQAAPQQQAADPLAASARAITAIESGGRYDALGPTVRNGDRAYGRYQVMGSNIPAWTEKYLGQRLTPEQFLASPEAQDAVFRGEFGRLAQKYGPEGAARAWFAGEGGMNDPNRRDVLGTSVADYSSKFTANYGQGATNPLANVAPMQAPAPQATPQQPMTLAQLAAPQQAPQINMETLASLATNRYGAPIAQQIIARQLGRDPMQQALQMEQLRAAQLGNQRLASELAGEGGKVTYQDLGDTIGVFDQRGNIVRQIPKGTKSQPLTVKEGETVINPATGQVMFQGQNKSGEFQKTLDKKNAEMFSGLLDQKSQVESDLADIDNLNRLLQTAPVGGQARAARFLTGLGIQTDAGAKVQQFDAIVNKLVPSQRPPGSGTMSDRDVELFKSSLPDLTKTKEGSQQIVDTMQGIARYKQQQSAIAEAVATGRMSQQDGLKALQSIPNPLAWVREMQKQRQQTSVSAGDAQAKPQSGPRKTSTGIQWILE